ncbi:MAG: multiheme c-type cytochrome [Candidatus Aminicenantales bacterium]
MAGKKGVILLIGLSLFFPWMTSMSSSDSIVSVESSKTCKQCHEEIYNHWKNAMHAISIEDPIFKASYMESYLKTSGKAKFDCLPCHAPVVLINNDYDLEKEVTREGVSCDFCHSVKDVIPGKGGNPFVFEPGKTKIGPYARAESPAHKTKPSPIFKSSEFCAGCHEYTNRNGVKILGTFSEWQESPYPEEGVHCQACHMPLIPGRIVKRDVKSSNRKRINLHAISAAHSKDQLQKALRVEIVNIHKEEQVIEVTVGITNTGSGHVVPTGIPSRKLLLLVEMKTPNEVFTQQRRYEKIIVDANGNDIRKECDAFLEAEKISFDNRLKPKEKRIEKFSFVRPETRKTTISARIYYLYKTSVLSPTEMRVKMAEDVKSISK